MTDLVPIRRQDMEMPTAMPAALPVPHGVSMLRAWAMRFWEDCRA